MTASKPDNKDKSYAEEEDRAIAQGSGMGIFPEEISFTQNIGCAGGKSKTSKKKRFSQ
ncbi:hypothetical protein PBT90_19800 [Algoriphagus halophytocola]|uniref:Bacteriocin n=1 Tax=Algoriphagus halophytocola TaxID=2991499 RepID=A0ABY6MDC2_9BACT|nr:MULTISPECIES: hypothetical protein [unclassified Algoriphagus]UZD21762.1 hypothetical protein OM944_13935 [Algoriphagus sp. TR-M5]WBL42974.1 hypothetical protein PBT90_19800 [Algoriphagus sp. TR-M9]